MNVLYGTFATRLVSGAQVTPLIRAFEWGSQSLPGLLKDWDPAHLFSNDILTLPFDMVFGIIGNGSLLFVK